MPAKSNFKKHLSEIKKNPQRLFIIGVRSVFEPDEYYAYNRIEPFFSDLMRYVDRNKGFTSESISHIAFYRLSNGESANLLYFGSSLVVNLFS